MSFAPCTNEAVTGIRVVNRPQDSIQTLDGHTLRRFLDAAKFPFSTLSMRASDFLVRYNERVTDVCFAVPTHPPPGNEGDVTFVYGLSFRISRGEPIRNATPPATAATRAAARARVAATRATARARVAATLARAAAARAARAAGA